MITNLRMDLCFKLYRPLYCAAHRSCCKFPDTLCILIRVPKTHYGSSGALIRNNCRHVKIKLEKSKRKINLSQCYPSILGGELADDQIVAACVQILQTVPLEYYIITLLHYYIITGPLAGTTEILQICILSFVYHW